MLATTDFLTPYVAPNDPLTTSAEELPIAQRKGIHTCNPNVEYACTNLYHLLSPFYFSVISSFDFVSVPKSTSETIADPCWCVR